MNDLQQYWLKGDDDDIQREHTMSRKMLILSRQSRTLQM
jgi:hypothetical protein